MKAPFASSKRFSAADVTTAAILTVMLAMGASNLLPLDVSTRARTAGAFLVAHLHLTGQRNAS